MSSENVEDNQHDDNNDVNSIPIASPPRRRHRRRDEEYPQQPAAAAAEEQPPIPEPIRPITVRELDELTTDYDDYFTNPLVSHSVFDTNDVAVDEIDRAIAQLTQSLMPQQLQQPQSSSFAATTTTGVPGQVTLPSMLRPDVSSQTNATFPSDPYSVTGKVVKNARVYVESVDIPQNSNWSGGIDYLEEGRLIGFSITCNDPDITPTVFIENSSGTKDVINDLSFRQAVQHGRGMTLSEATSTFMTPNGLVSRDVSGQPSTIFPYVKRYKDQMTGDGVYADVRNTEDDKSYVMNYEPTTSIPYQRISFQVYNGSSLGTRMINRLEIKRLVYVDPDPIVVSTLVPSDMSQVSTALNMLASHVKGVPNRVIPPPLVPATSTSNFASTTDDGGGSGDINSAAAVFNKIYADFIRFAYKQLNDTTKMTFQENKVHIAELEEQKQIQELSRMVDEGLDDDKAKKRQQLISKPINNPNTLFISWE
jgi:hypothetical protein